MMTCYFCLANTVFEVRYLWMTGEPQRGGSAETAEEVTMKGGRFTLEEQLRERKQFATLALISSKKPEEIPGIFTGLCDNYILAAEDKQGDILATFYFGYGCTAIHEYYIGMPRFDLDGRNKHLFSFAHAMWLMSQNKRCLEQLRKVIIDTFFECIYYSSENSDAQDRYFEMTVSMLASAELNEWFVDVYERLRCQAFDFAFIQRQIIRLPKWSHMLHTPPNQLGSASQLFLLLQRLYIERMSSKKESVFTAQVVHCIAIEKEIPGVIEHLLGRVEYTKKIVGQIVDSLRELKLYPGKQREYFLPDVVVTYACWGKEENDQPILGAKIVLTYTLLDCRLYPSEWELCRSYFEKELDSIVGLSVVPLHVKMEVKEKNGDVLEVVDLLEKKKGSWK